MPPPAAGLTPQPRTAHPTILCVGEILWDALPEGLFLGGAPLNVACHLRALGERAAVGSRVGDDILGTEALRRLAARGLDTDLVQVDDALPTGLVRVALDPTGEPDYEIVDPAAWDAIELTDALREQAERAEVLVFGSLAQRTSTSRQTIHELCQTDLLRVFDVNLRPPYVDWDVIEASLRAADVVKMNEEELRRIGGALDLPAGVDAAPAGVAEQFGCRAVCVTRGPKGASLWTDGGYSEQPGYTVEVADTVGAGDAFLAALITGLLDGRDAETALDRANRLGAYVASRRGAVPAYEVDDLDDIGELSLPPPNRSTSG